MGRSPVLAISKSISRRPSLAITSPSANLYSPGIIGCLQALSSAGFSLRGLVLARTKPRRLKPALLLTESDDAPSPVLCRREKFLPLAPHSPFPARLPSRL